MRDVRTRQVPIAALQAPSPWVQAVLPSVQGPRQMRPTSAALNL
jgi:hypothetical protein